MSTLYDVIVAVASQTSTVKNQTQPKSAKRVSIVIDVSCSTGSPFLPGKMVLEKEIEVAEQLMLNNPDDIYTVVSFDDRVNTFEVHILKEEMMTNIHTFSMRPGGSTCTDRAFSKVIEMKQKPSHIVLLTDGQTNSNQITLQNQMETFQKNNISLEVIAVSDSNIDLAILTQNEEQRIPGMDLINYLGNSISKLTIYNKKHSDVPYVGASTSTVGKNCVRFMEVPVTGFIPDFIRTLVSVLKEKEINWGTNQMEFKKFLSEIGKLLSALFVSFPESNMFVEDIILKLNEFNLASMNSDRIRNIIKYGFDCTRSKKPILYTNFEAHVKESVVKKAEFADAITQLKLQGTTLNADMSISMPQNGLVVINRNTIPLENSLGMYPSSGDKFRNYYFGIGANPQAIRIGMREFCGFLGVKNPVGSNAVIFYILNQMSLMYINGIALESDVMKYYRELAIHQTSLETLVDKGKYSGIGCYAQWKNGLLPKMHFSDSKTHTSLYTDPFVNPLRLNEPLWWAFMMSMLGIFNEQLNVYEESIKGLQIESNETEFLNWVRNTFQSVVNGNIQIVKAEPVPTSLFTLSEFEADDEVYVLKDHGNCKTRTPYSKDEIDDYVMKPGNGCCWCHFQPNMNDFERVTFDNPIEKIENAKAVARPLSVDMQKLKSLNLSPNIAFSMSSLNQSRLIRINMIGITGAGKSTFSKRISEMIIEKGFKCIVLSADKWSKRGKKGKELVNCIRNEMKEFDKVPSKLKVVIVDICNENGPQQNCFETDFTNYEEYDFMPNMIPEKFNQYECWCLRNVLSRGNSNENTLYWLNPVSAGVNTCVKVHKSKASGVRRFCNITVPAVSLNENWTLQQAFESVKKDADEYETELQKTTIDNDIIKLFNEIGF